MLPASIRINRGKLSLRELAEKASDLRANRIILLERWKGAPGKVEFHILSPWEEHPFLILYLAYVRTQREFGGPTPGGNRIVASVEESSRQGVRLLAKAMTSFLQVPLLESDSFVSHDACLTFGNAEGYEAMVTFRNLLENKEVGPRLVVRHMVFASGVMHE